jgi:ABC-type proline/glycine betaine transport system substrate-binding protein
MKKLIAFICIVLVILSLPSTAFAAKKDTKAPTVTKTNPQDKTGAS